MPSEEFLDTTDQKTILLVEDNDSIRMLLNTIISAAHFNVICANNGQEGLEKLQNCSPDLILSDICMPTMSGKEFLSKVKENSALNHIPVVMLTADSDQEIEQELLKLGAHQLVAKGGSHKELMALIKSVISKPNI